MFRIFRVVYATIAAVTAGSLAAQSPDPPYILTEPQGTLLIDGKLDDPFWSAVKMLPFQPGEDGVPAELGGTFGMALRGQWLCFSARLPEPGGKVLARSFGHDPIWQKDANGAPPVEDRLEYRLHYRSSSGKDRVLTITVNPWGAYRVDQDGQPVPEPRIEQAALVTSAGWTVEAALSLRALDLDWRTTSRQLSSQAVRIRSRRPLAPEFRWSSQMALRFPSETAPAKDLPAPDFRPPALGNNDPPFEVGRVLSVPPIDSTWDDPLWQDVPAFSLPRNEPFARAPQRGTQVKWVHDGQTLALLIRAEESEPLVARTGGRDSTFTADDHLTVYLATTGSAFVEIMVNTVGGVRDSLAAGGPHMTSLQSSWNADIKAQTNIRYGSWTARIDIPLLDCAKALGESRIPNSWRVVLSRYRAARPGDAAEVSALPPIGTETFYGPIRYNRLLLSGRSPSQVHRIPEPSKPDGLDPHVWPTAYRRHRQARTMVAAQQRKRVERAILAEHGAWDSVKTREDWEKFRDVRMEALRGAVGDVSVKRGPSEVLTTARRDGRGYRLENLVYQSRPGFYVPANLYLPANTSAPMPAIIILHSFHYPKTQGELHDMGELWARTGCAVLIPERLGFGERVETSPWYREAYRSRFLFKQQLNLIGETQIGWMAWDLIRAVDMLYERPDIDRSRIIVMGAVAGGAESAAVAAALDTRISALVAYNYDHSHARLDADFPGELSKQFNMSLITNSLAPRRYVHAFEFGWEGAEEPEYPELWTSSWQRSLKVWGFYGAESNIASAQGYGLIRLSMERVSHSWSIGPQHRRDLYPLLQRWFRIPFPSAEDQAILPDSELSVNPYREEARRQEAQRRRPLADLSSIPPSVSAKLPRKPMHQVAREMAETLLTAARSRRGGLDTPQARKKLQLEIQSKLGDVDPERNPRAESFPAVSLPGTRVEAIGLRVEDGIEVPLLLIRPSGQSHAPVVVAVSQEGKGRFLASRAGEIQTLLRAGVAVCLPDLRGTGETAPDPDWQNEGRSLAEMEVALGNTLMGARVKDLRTVLAYLRRTPEIDAGRIALWGESFAPPNSSELFLDELEQEAGPQIQYHAEPLGGAVTLLTALLEDDIHAVAARGGLAGYVTVLDNAFAYIPSDTIVPGILKAGDIADIAAAYAPSPLLLETLVNGRNVRLSLAELGTMLGPVMQAYQKSRARDRLTLRSEPGDVASWLAAQLK